MVDEQLAAPVDARNIIVVIVYLVIIVLALYFLTKYITQRRLKKGVSTKNAPKKGIKANLKATFFSKDGEERLLAIVDRVAVDRDKTLMVVEFQGKYYLMSTTGQEIRLLDKVPAPETVVEHMEDIDEAEDSNGNPAASCDVEAAEPDSFWRRFADNFKMQAKERGDGFRKRFFKREWKKSEPGTFESELGKRIQQEEDAEGENGGRKEG